MAECSKCKIGVGCACNLTNGLCKNCYVQSKSMPNTCNANLQQLRNMLNQLYRKPKNSTINYQISILKSQINEFNTDPCKFNSVISNIRL